MTIKIMVNIKLQCHTFSQVMCSDVAAAGVDCSVDVASRRSSSCFCLLSCLSLSLSALHSSTVNGGSCIKHVHTSHVQTYTIFILNNWLTFPSG